MRGDAGRGDAAILTPTDDFAISSTDFSVDEEFPAEFRCAGRNDPGESPALQWSPGPDGTQSYAVQLRDTAADVVVKTYWLIYDLPGDVSALPPRVPVGNVIEAPVAARQASNDSRSPANEFGYRGPCGAESTYEFSVHALDVPALDIGEGATAAEVLDLISEHEIGVAKLEFTAAKR